MSVGMTVKFVGNLAIRGVLVQVFNRTLSFEYKLLGDGVYELKVHQWISISFLGLGYGRLKSKHYGDLTKVEGFVYEELVKS